MDEVSIGNIGKGLHSLFLGISFRTYYHSAPSKPQILLLSSDYDSLIQIYSKTLNSLLIVTMNLLCHQISPGGGFGPVADDGYGVSYMVPDDHQIFFHISSKISSKQTDSDRFIKFLFESMSEIKELYESVKATKGQVPNSTPS